MTQVVSHVALRPITIHLAHSAGKLRRGVQHTQRNNHNQKPFSPLLAAPDNGEVSPGEDRNSHTEKNQSVSGKDNWLLMSQVSDDQQRKKGEEENEHG